MEVIVIKCLKVGNLSPAPSLLVAPCGQADVVQVSEEMEVIRLFLLFSALD